MKNKQIIFIHIPKTGGTTIQHALDIRGCNHIDRYKYTDDSNKYFFTFVRNPWDRLVSAYTYLKSDTCNNGDKKHGAQLPNTFDGFVTQLLLNKTTWLKKLHFRPMMHFICDINSINFIGRFETLQQDFNNMCDSIGIQRSVLLHKNESDHNHYTTYYNDKTRDIVSNLYEQDIKNFNYNFNNDMS